ncbi:hypothetical protein GW916_09710 [bacterium]|nr:hypothetical protein [bacterium]
MRNLIFSGLLLGLIGCSALQPIQRTSSGPELRDVPVDARGEDGMRHRLLVLPFLDENLNRAGEASEVARESLLRELGRSGLFVLVALSDFPGDPKEFIKEGQEYDLNRISRVVAPLGVSAVIEGKVIDLQAKKKGDSVGVFRNQKVMVESKVRLRIAAGRSGREIFNQVASAKEEASATQVGNQSKISAEDPWLITESTKKAYMSLLPQVIQSIEKLNWEGRVAMVSGEKIYVNAGRLSGIQVGDLLKVSEDGTEIFDPETGRFIGMAPGRMKGTLEVISYFGKDGAITVIHSGNGFKENDLVQLY